MAEQTVMTASEYSDSVREWLMQAYQWHALAYTLPSYMAYQASLQQSTPNSQDANNNRQDARSNYFFNLNGPQQPQQQQGGGGPRLQYVEYKVPALWKRFAAEFIDFLVLFLLKIIVTFVAVDWFSIIDLDRYDLTFLAAIAGRDIDVQTAVDFTSDFMILEFIHRLVVCVFEALCTHRGFGGIPGGATPGKMALGLRIVYCQEIVGLPEPDRVQVSPATDLGLGKATVRAILKSAALAFFFPVFFTFVFLQYNRTMYDIMSKSIVVESVPPTRRRRQAN